MNQGLGEAYRWVAEALGYEPKKSIEKILSSIDPSSPGLYALILPTGYGKTTIFYTLALHSIMAPEESSGAVYAAPLRSLIDNVYRKWEKILKKRGYSAGEIECLTGVQHMGLYGSIYLNKPVVYTTYDTLLLHLFKIPPPEIRGIAMDVTLGHAEVSRARLADSIVFLDEPHLSLSDPVMISSLLASIIVLARMGSTVILSTATMPIPLLRAVTEGVLRHGKPKAGEYHIRIISLRKTGLSLQGVEETVIKDKDYPSYTSGAVDYGFTMDNETMSKAVEECRSGKRVAVILNTRRRAKEKYMRIRNIAGKECRVKLLHSAISSGERINILRETLWDSENHRPFILVSTQVVEAGVDISFDTMITDPCPATSLIQRTGRVARWRGEGRGQLLIIDDGDAGPYNKGEVEATLKMLKQEKIDLKNPYGTRNVKGYLELIERTLDQRVIREAEEKTHSKILNLVSPPHLSVQGTLWDLLGGELIRSTVILGVTVEDTGEILPLTQGLFKRILIDNAFTGGLGYNGEKLGSKEVSDILSKCRWRGPWWIGCIEYVLLTRIKTLYISRETYWEIAYGVKY